MLLGRLSNLSTNKQTPSRRRTVKHKRVSFTSARAILPVCLPRSGRSHPSQTKTVMSLSVNTNLTKSMYLSELPCIKKFGLPPSASCPVKRQVYDEQRWECLFVCWLVGCLTSQQHASVSQGRICTDNFTCCHTEIEAADQTFHLTQSQYTDTGPTSPSADPITTGAWQGSQWSANF